MDAKWLITTFLPVASLIIGAGLARWSETRGGLRQLERETTLRDIERTQARIDRREAFELTHLMEVFNTLNDMFRAALAMRQAALGQPTGIADTDLMTRNHAYTTQRALILDGEARAAADEAHKYINLMIIPPYSDIMDPAVVVALDKLNAAMEAIGKRLRDIYGDPIELPTQLRRLLRRRVTNPS